MIGKNFSIKVKSSKKPIIVNVTVQANKNYGICDLQFREGIEGSEQLRSNLLSKIQGRQLNDENVCIHVYNLLEEALNS